MKKSFLQISIASTITLFAIAAIVSASTTIGDNISTDGTLNVVGTTTFSGNVGIGTTTPTDLLHITGDDDVSIAIENTNINGVKWRFLTDSSGILKIRDQDNTKNPLAIEASAPADSFYINSTGNVGIGTSTPSAKLHIADTDPKIVIGSSIPNIWYTDTYDIGLLQIGLNTFSATDHRLSSSWLALSNNTYFATDGNWKRIVNASSTQQTQYGGEHYFKVAGPDAADSTITWKNAMIIDNYGNITKPLQPSFLAYNSSTDSNVTGAGTFLYSEFDSEAFDQGDNYDTSTDTFTAPTTGKYAFTAKINLLNVTDAMNDFLLQIVTSNRTFNKQQVNAVAGTHDMEMTIFTDMDAGDTAKVGIRLSNGAGDTASIYGAAAPAMYTVFSGYLVN